MHNAEANQRPCPCLAETENVHESLPADHIPQFRIGAEYRTAPAMCQRTCRYVGRTEWNPHFLPSGLPRPPGADSLLPKSLTPQPLPPPTPAPQPTHLP